MQCKKCDFMFIYPPPTIQTQKEYYNKSYQKGTYKVYTNQDNLRKKLNEKRYLEIEKYNPKGNLLDIGCASGFFLDVATKYGLSIFGVELSEEAVKIARLKNKNIFHGTLEAAKYNNSFFDIVTIYDIIEHVVDPNSMMKEVSRIIKPGGLIVITTPDTNSWHAKIMRKNWGFIIPLEHLCYFSHLSMKLLLEKNGF